MLALRCAAVGTARLAVAAAPQPAVPLRGRRTAPPQLHTLHHRLSLSQQPGCRPIVLLRQYSTPPDDQQQTKLSWYGRAKQKIKTYGRVGLATYLVVDGISILLLTGLVYEGVDVVGLLNQIGISHPRLENVGNTLLSAWAIAVAVNKITVPVRLPVTLFLTPRVYRWWHGHDPITHQSDHSSDHSSH